MKVHKKHYIILATAIMAALSIFVPLIVIAYKRYKIAMNTTNNISATGRLNAKLPRGYRNNNPLNIRVGTSNWAGKRTFNTDGVFEQFENMGYGFRAALKLLRNYIGNGHNTIAKMIARWAPANENNTRSYIANVAQRSGINPDTIIGKDDRAALVKIAYAMAISENGTAPLMTDIEAGWEML